MARLLLACRRTDAELKSVPVVVAARTAPAARAPAPEAPVSTVGRQVLTTTVAVGALAGTLLVLVALGFWRWGSHAPQGLPVVREQDQPLGADQPALLPRRLTLRRASPAGGAAPL